MSPTAAAADRYLTDRVMTASPAELTAMLFDACVGALRAAVALQEGGEHLAATPRLVKAQSIVLELRTSLNREAGPLAEQLDALYTYAFAQLLQANTRRDVTATRTALDVDRSAAVRLARGVPHLRRGVLTR